jgi:hypothetical protein
MTSASFDQETFNRGKSLTETMFNVFDDAFEQFLWKLETPMGFRNAQVWVSDKV